MENIKEEVDGFRFLPPGLAAWIRTFIPEGEYQGAIPWVPLDKPLSAATVAVVTSAGISLKSDTPFDMEKEKRDPTWGDPTYRVLPKTTTAGEINVNHLHINISYILEDINVILPLERMAELESEGTVGALAPSAYSFYGFQWGGTQFLEEAIAPMSQQMKAENVDAVLLTPA
jgi:D-proline reductase (dithiol) PrdB